MNLYSHCIVSIMEDLLTTPTIICRGQVLFITVIILCNYVIDCIIGEQTTSYNMGSLGSASTTLCLDWISSSSITVDITTDWNL